MSRLHHLVYAVAAVGLAVWVLGGASPALAGLGFAVLLCPVVMGLVMWLLLRQPGQHGQPGQPVRPERPEQTADDHPVDWRARHVAAGRR